MTKRIILSKCCFLFILVLGQIQIYAQQNTQEIIEQYKLQLKKEDDLRKSRIKEYLQNHTIPINGYDSKGNYLFLHHIDEQQRPVYYAAKEADGKKAINDIAATYGGTADPKDLDSLKMVQLSVQSTSNNNTQIVLDLPLITITPQSILKDGVFKIISSSSAIHSITIVTDHGKRKFYKGALAVNDFSIQTKSWKKGNYLLMIQLQNKQTYLNYITL